MGRVAACLAVVVGVAAAAASPALAQPTSEGHPHKWQTVTKSMADYLAAGFELKTVVYDATQTGADLPDVHYFLQKQTRLVRCDFRKREETSYYWCAELVKPK